MPCVKLVSCHTRCKHDARDLFVNLPKTTVFLRPRLISIMVLASACGAPVPATVQFQPNVIIYSPTNTPVPSVTVGIKLTSPPTPTIRGVQTATPSGALALIASPTPGKLAPTSVSTPTPTSSPGVTQTAVQPSETKAAIAVVSVVDAATQTPTLTLDRATTTPDDASTPTPTVIKPAATRLVSAPTVSATTSASGLVYDTPQLLGPLFGERFTGIDGPPIHWVASTKPLAALDFYAVTIHHNSGWDMRCYKGITAQPAQYLPMLQPKSGFDTFVTVVRLNTVVGEGASCDGIAVSPPSATTNFYWTRG